MTDSIRPAIRAYLGALMVSSEQIVMGEAADDFIAGHPDQVDQYAANLIRRAVQAELDALCAERVEDTGQLGLFPGIPAGIHIAPGIVKPRDRCTWADLQIGRRERVENIEHAAKKLDLYDEDLDALRPLMMDDPDLTLADARKRLEANGR